MNKTTKEKIRANQLLNTLVVKTYRRFLKPLKLLPGQFKLYRSTKKQLTRAHNQKCVFYIGIPAHNNLGDLAQGVCIRKWLKKHFCGWEIIEIETNALVNTKFSAKKYLKAAFKPGNIIVFQSGYTTTDLGGHADEMHCEVIKLLPNAPMLMLPQTVFFESESRKQNTARVYNSAKNMLFLARDKVSFQTAQQMFPDLRVLLYPDIVTTLIGKFNFNYKRSGILFCCRDDSEKYYSDEEILALMQQCSSLAKVERTDTTKEIKTKEIVANAEKYILQEIERYSKYEVIVTDRYHGTIFALAAGTPVVIIKTTDHKVTTGADWFVGVYDEYVHLASTPAQAFEMAKQLIFNKVSHTLAPYFEKKYYDALPTTFFELLK